MSWPRSVCSIARAPSTWCAPWWAWPCRRARQSPTSAQQALQAALLATRSIVYSRLGASGVYFAGLIERLGIADAVNAKATIIPSGLTGELVARGEVE